MRESWMKAGVPFCTDAIFSLLNMFAVKYYGGMAYICYGHRIPSYGDAESEFWLAIGKVILAVGLICFTFISMVGGNPRRDVYGFRYWKCKHCFLIDYLLVDSNTAPSIKCCRCTFCSIRWGRESRALSRFFGLSDFSVLHNVWSWLRCNDCWRG